MIYDWIRRLLDVCRKQRSDPKKTSPPSTNVHSNDNPYGSANTQYIPPGNEGLFYTGVVIGGMDTTHSDYCGHHGEGQSSCNAGDDGGSGGDGGDCGGDGGGCGGDGGGCGGGCGGCGGD